jgi:release factor glutamine methyltransferase
MSIIWREAINANTKILEHAGIADAKANAEYLAAHVLGFWNKSELRPFLEAAISEEDFKKYEVLVARRLAHEPLQHIIGETEFFGFRLLTSSAALIPRPETEIVVEEILSIASQRRMTKDDGRLAILDIGTGSGAIALAIASRLPQARVHAIDISSDAIALAEQNKKRLDLDNVTFEVLNFFHPDFEYKFRHLFDIVVSNPPYISIEEFQTLETEVKDYDPRIALTDEADGFIFYKRIAEIAPQILKKNGKIVVETGYTGARAVKKIFNDAGLNTVRIINDLQGIERVVVAE